MADSTFEDLGPNSGLAEEMSREYVENPAAVPEVWREFFARREQSAPEAPPTRDGPTADAVAPRPASAPPAETAPAPLREPEAAAGAEVAAEPQGKPEPDGEAERPIPIRGALARIVENMEASLEVPTATSVRTVPAKLDMFSNCTTMTSHSRSSLTACRQTESIARTRSSSSLLMRAITLSATNQPPRVAMALRHHAITIASARSTLTCGA